MDDKPASCSRYRVEELSRYLVGNLSHRRKKRIEQHLSSCPHCRQRIRELTAVQKALRHVPDVAPPRNFFLSEADVRTPGRKLWYPVLRTSTIAVAALVLVLLLGGVLQPGLLTLGAPTPRPVGVKATPLIAPTPLPVAIAPANTCRARPTPMNEVPAITGTPDTVGPDAVGPGYPQPAASPPPIEGTVIQPDRPSTATAATSQPTALWSAIHLGGLVLLSILAGLTWLAYRRERAFFS